MIWEGKRVTSSIRYHLLNIHETPLQIADSKLPILEPACSKLSGVFSRFALLCFALLNKFMLKQALLAELFPLTRKESSQTPVLATG